MEAPGATTADLLAALRRRGVDDVDDSTVTRAAYSTDASLFRVVPQAVVRPRHPDELAAVVDVARELRTPVTMRGAGTSIAGNAVGPGLVVDTLKHLNKVVSVDAEAGTAVVQPGTVHAVLQKAAVAQGWRFGPDPSTHTRCTIGGMIGNNACGSRALGYGRMVDNVEALSVVMGTGDALALGPGGAIGAGDVAGSLDRIVGAHLGPIRTQFGRFGRQVSGYSLEHLLPENGRRLDRFLTGSEGTLGVVTQATVRLVRDAPARTMAVLGYPSMVEAADAVPALLAHPLVACEGLDARIVDLVRGAGKAVPELPKGGGWLFAEVTGETLEETLALLERVVADSDALDSRVVVDPAESAALWRIREDGAGLAGRSFATPAYSGWEDAAVPPQHLGAYLRDFDALLGDHGLQGVPYGHFGDGCVHVRIDFPLAHRSASLEEGRSVFRSFLESCADMLATYGGSLSGEHGDGRVRSELLTRMYDAEAIRLFGEVKAVCDPLGILNPGNIADPAPLDADLRTSAGRHREPLPLLRFEHDNGSMADAVHRCTGVGKCLVGGGIGTSAGVMCPSYAATRNEKDTTRGRARVLQEALAGDLVDGLSDPAVHEALDLCLACKGCANDCPTGIDMATYKSETLHQTYAGKRRPRSHYVLGRLPMWARLTTPVAKVANASLKAGPVARVARSVAGVDQRRSLPQFASRTLRRSARAADAAGRVGAVETPDVWIWADSFTNHFLPASGLAAVRFLESQGLRVRVIDERACCGLTWITTGQLDTARRIAARTAATLAPYVASGVPVVGIEPSCTATLRSDLTELSDAPEAAAVADGLMTFGELLARLVVEEKVVLPDLTGTTVVAQPHCHHASVLGWETDERLLRATGASVTRVGGCCGLAGNFGVEQGHYEVSVAVAETQLLPAVRAAYARDPETVVLADGMSCKIQLDDLADVPALHLAELLASRI